MGKTADKQQAGPVFGELRAKAVVALAQYIHSSGGLEASSPEEWLWRLFGSQRHKFKLMAEIQWALWELQEKHPPRLSQGDVINLEWERARLEDEALRVAVHGAVQRLVRDAEYAGVPYDGKEPSPGQVREWAMLMNLHRLVDPALERREASLAQIQREGLEPKELTEEPPRE